ncbi:MAG: FkbM family methyltransferase [Bacteroidales bacterium]|nr:FkbM family methyltransferase [Bacteroidales bacterium]
MRRKFPLRHALISALLDVDVKGIRKIAHHLPGLLIPKPRGVVTMRTLYGFWLLIDPVKDEGVERSIYYTGTYEKGTLAVMKRLLRKGDTFVDVGANIGLMSLFASALVGDEGRVQAFEPNPETAGILRENIRINKMSNIEVSEFAVGKTPGKARIYDRWDSNRGSASLIKPDWDSNSYEISMTTLTEFFSEGQEGKEGKEIHLIKLDIEGYELDALEGALDILQRVDPPMLIVECSKTRENTNGSGTQQLFKFIRKLDCYRIFTGRKDKSRVSRLKEVMDHGGLREHDNIYCFTSNHLSALPKHLFKPSLNAN